MKPTYIGLRLLLGLLLTPLSLSYAHTITLDDAVQQVQGSVSGKIVSAKTETDNDGEYHIIRILTPEGRISPIMIHARKHPHEQ